MSALHEDIIRDLYRHLVEVEQVPYPVEDYLTGEEDQRRLAISIIGVDNCFPPCGACDAPAEHWPGVESEPFCADCCPECNERTN